MSSQSLWNILTEHNLVKGDKPNDQEHIPWYIRFMQGFAGWVAALFLLGFFGAAFGLLFRNPNAGLLFTLGILCSVGTYVIMRLQKNEFFDQAGLAVSLCGQLLFAFGLFQLKVKFGPSMFIMGTYQLFLAYIIPQYAHRLITTMFGVLAILIGINYAGLYGLGSALVAVLFSFIWIKETSWNKFRDVWEPIGYGIAITIVFSSGFLLTGKYLIRETYRGGSGWLFENAHLVNSLIISLIFLNLVIVVLKENKISYNSKTAILSFIAAAGLILTSFEISGISSGLLILIIGFARQRMTLVVLGSISVISFFSWYYYNLQTTLLVKSIVLIVLGLTVLASWATLKYIYGDSNTDTISKLRPRPFNNNKYIGIVTIAIALIAINININKKQDLIENGEVLLFELAPVDPRSIMQGDYMRLRFDLERKIVTAMDLWNKNNTIVKSYGHAIVTKDAKNIVSFVAIYNDQIINEDQRLIPFKIRNRKVTFTTNAFYFQEGQANHFQQSKYGEFRMSEDGEIILVRMTDKDLNIL